MRLGVECTAHGGPAFAHWPARVINLPFLYPGEDICREFSRIVAPWFARVRANTDEIRELAALRDALLPQLLSDEIRLREAERAVDDALRSTGYQHYPTGPLARARG